MKPASASAVIVVTCLFLASSVATAQDFFPKRKSGLWEMSMGETGKAMSLCVDHSRDDAMKQLGMQMSQEMQCTRSNVKQAGGAFSFDQSCQMANMKWTSSIKVTGSFDSAYKVEMDTKYDPPMMGKAESKRVIDAKWVGSCKAGQRPGDMVMPGGMTMNVYDMLDSKKK